MLDRNIARFDDSKRALAKIMARKNISVQIINGAKTASYNVLAKVLTLPNWPNLTVDQFDTLIVHEVGHALNTDHSYLDRLQERRKAKLGTARLFTYVNVVEDARIERCMREMYPGMNGVFFNGYQDFTTQGPILKIASKTHVIVGGETMAIAKLPLIDRINLHYKIGAFVTVPFSPEEAAFLPEIDRSHSTKDATRIAEKIYDYAKDHEPPPPPPQKPEPGKGESGEGGESDESGDTGDGEESDDKQGDSGNDSADDDSKGDEETEGAGAGDGDESDESDDAGDDGDQEHAGGDTPEGAEPKSEDAKDGTGDEPKPEPEAPESLTEKDINEILKALAESHDPAAEIKHLLIAPLGDREVARRTITASRWTERVEHHLKGLNSPDVIERTFQNVEDAWNGKYLATAHHMASEFTRRKAADRLQHARPGRMGKINMNRLHAYRYADDIFNRVMIEHTGQSHGIVMMIDGSSSMDEVFGNVIDQTLLFAHFAFQCNIPFEAYMFSDCTVAPDMGLSATAEIDNSIVPGNGRLVGLINTATERSGFKRQVRAVLALRAMFLHDTAFQHNLRVSELPYGDLGGTPLYAGLMLLERQVARMKRTQKLDKMMTVVISDGGDTDGLCYRTNEYVGGCVTQHFQRLTANQAFVARDTVTKKNHVFVEASDMGRTTYTAPTNAVLTLLFDVIRDRHNARNIFMFLVGSRHGGQEAEHIMRRAGERSACASGSAIEQALGSAQQFIVPNGAADLNLVVLTTALALREEELAAVNARNMNDKELQQAYTDARERTRSNRVFVNTVIPFLI